MKFPPLFLLEFKLKSNSLSQNIEGDSFNFEPITLSLLTTSPNIPSHLKTDREHKQTTGIEFLNNRVFLLTVTSL
jgi:hypothetical protein